MSSFMKNPIHDSSMTWPEEKSQDLSMIMAPYQNTSASSSRSPGEWPIENCSEDHSLYPPAEIDTTNWAQVPPNFFDLQRSAGCYDKSYTIGEIIRPTGTVENNFPARHTCHDRYHFTSQTPSTLQFSHTLNQDQVPRRPSLTVTGDGPDHFNVEPQHSIYAPLAESGLRCRWIGCPYIGTFGRVTELKRHVET